MLLVNGAHQKICICTVYDVSSFSCHDYDSTKYRVILVECAVDNKLQNGIHE